MLTMSFAFVVSVTLDPVSTVQFTTEIVKLAFWGIKLYLIAKQLNVSSKKNSN